LVFSIVTGGSHRPDGYKWDRENAIEALVRVLDELPSTRKLTAAAYQRLSGGRTDLPPMEVLKSLDYYSSDPLARLVSSAERRREDRSWSFYGYR